MKEMEFRTDKFMRSLWEMLDTLKNDFVGDMANGATSVARRLIDEPNNAKALVHMNEIRTITDMANNYQHDCKALYDAFDKRFRFDHGDQKHSATALDVMRIITEISSDIQDIAPHIEFLFEPSDECIPSLFRDAFVTTFEVPAE